MLLVSGDDPFLPFNVPLELLDEAFLLGDYFLHGLQRCNYFLRSSLVRLGLLRHALHEGTELLAGGASREQVRLVVGQTIHVIEQALLVDGREWQFAVAYIILLACHPICRVPFAPL